MLLLLFLVAVKTNAQDIIIKNDNDSIHCKIKEISDEEIKYIDPDISNEILIGINKDKVNKVILANGKELSFKEYLYDPDNYVSDKKNNLKINFLSPLFNSTNICYERSLKPGRSIEGTIGIIGAGWDYGDEQRGAFVKFGYKFIKSPDYYIKGQKFAHILKGSYIRPEIAFSLYSYDESDYWYYDDDDLTEFGNDRETVIMGAILLNFGKQWIFENGFLVDTFMGIGYGFGQDNNYFEQHRAFVGGDDDFPIAFTTGVRIGWNF